MIKSPSNVFLEFGVSSDVMQRALNSSLLTTNEMREKFGLPRIEDVTPDNLTKAETKTIRRAVLCQNCGANEYTNNGGAFVCNYCGTTYEKGATICE